MVVGLSSGRSINDWYRRSRGGTRGEFLSEVSRLDAESLITLAKKEVACPPRGSLRTKSELQILGRAVSPSIEFLQVQRPTEQVLQWLIMHRGFLTSPSETILWRELPVCCADESPLGWADLLAFDQRVSQAILVELKDENADDPLCGALLELLSHWAFLLQHLSHFNTLLGEFGCIPTRPCRLAILAPNRFFEEGKKKSPRRNGEYERAISWIDGLSKAEVVNVDLYAIEPGWLNRGVSFRTWKV